MTSLSVTALSVSDRSLSDCETGASSGLFTNLRNVSQ